MEEKPHVRFKNDMYYMALPIDIDGERFYQSFWSSDGSHWYTDGNCYEHAHHAIGHAQNDDRSKDDSVRQ